MVLRKWLVRMFLLVIMLILGGAVFMSIPVPRITGLAFVPSIATGLALAVGGLTLLYWINKNAGRATP